MHLIEWDNILILVDDQGVYRHGSRFCTSIKGIPGMTSRYANDCKSLNNKIKKINGEPWNLDGTITHSKTNLSTMNMGRLGQALVLRDAKLPYFASLHHEHISQYDTICRCHAIFTNDERSEFKMFGPLPVKWLKNIPEYSNHPQLQSPQKLANGLPAEACGMSDGWLSEDD